MKNYYIIICLTPATMVDAESFVETNKDNFLNKGGNYSLEKIPTPDMPEMECYRFELSEKWYLHFEKELLELKAEIYESAEAYLLQYPPINEIENETN